MNFMDGVRISIDLSEWALPGEVEGGFGVDMLEKAAKNDCYQARGGHSAGLYICLIRRIIEQ
jgi:hypothetical protein